MERSAGIITMQDRALERPSLLPPVIIFAMNKKDLG